MKFSCTVTAIVATLAASTVGAFTPSTMNSGSHRASTSMNIKKFDNDQVGLMDRAETPGRLTQTEAEQETTSTALPFMARPPALDGSLAGDVGFDPFGFAKTKEALYAYREAEIKHARLAMLAAAGWPLAELWDRKLAAAFGLQPAVDAADRVPSVLNGGLGKINPLYWVAVLGAAAAIDLYEIQRKENAGSDYTIPGDLGFDPLGVYPEDAEGKRWMQLAEIKNGRLAMLAIFGFAIQEFVWGDSVVDQTPYFFKPIFEVFKTYSGEGSIDLN